jgi:putative ABC transport system permease protein
MRWPDLLRWVKTALLAHRLRSGLTIAGFATGVAAVVLMNAMGESLRLFVLNEFTQFGSNIIAITPGKTQTFGMGGLLNTVRPLTLEDNQYLQAMPQIHYAVPVIAGTAKVKAGNRSRYTDVVGVNHMAAQAWKLSLAYGQFLPQDDLLKPRNTAVLGAKLYQELFAQTSALGQFVHIGGQRFMVVGVLAAKGQFLGLDLDDMAYIPAAITMQLFNRLSLMELDLFYRPGFSAQTISELVKARLIRRHGREDFTIITQDDMLVSLDKILSMVKLAGTGLGMISLIVGAVGIATIMSVTVNERTAEIGLLRAVGCSSAKIKQLFLLEAISLAIISGLLGYCLVFFLLALVRLFITDLPLHLNLSVLFLALLFSGCIGLIAGLYPALNAAKLTPIDALRSE